LSKTYLNMDCLHRINYLSVQIYTLSERLPKMKRYSRIAQKKILHLVHNFDNLAIQAEESPEIKAKTFDNINLLHRIINAYNDTKREIGILTIEYEELLQIHTEQAPPIYDYFSKMVETITNREERTEESQSSENELLEFIKEVDLISIANYDDDMDSQLK